MKIREKKTFVSRRAYDLENQNGRISFIAWRCFSRPIYEIRVYESLEGDLDILQFDSLKEAKDRIAELLSEPVPDSVIPLPKSFSRDDGSGC